VAPVVADPRGRVYAYFCEGLSRIFTRNRMRAWIHEHQLATYFALAYVISWAVAVPLALQATGILETQLPWALHYLTAFGPAVAALLLLMVLREPIGAPRSHAFERSAVWWTVGFASPLLLFVIAQLVARTVGQPNGPPKSGAPLGTQDLRFPFPGVSSSLPSPPYLTRSAR